MSDFFFDDSKDHVYDDEFGPRRPAYRPAVSPGKVALTSRIAATAPAGARGHQQAASSSASGAPVQRKAMDHERIVPGSGMSNWDVAFRPDLCEGMQGEVGMAPVQRKQQGEPDGELSLPSSGGGAKLPDDVLAQMETSFGTDFSAVRIHEGSQATAVGALAYTQGTDIHFQPGQYDPNSQRGRELLGHELTHVVQQSQGRVQRTTQAKGVAINDDSSLEREADEMGTKVGRAKVFAPGHSNKGSNGAQDAPDTVSSDKSANRSLSALLGPDRQFVGRSESLALKHMGPTSRANAQAVKRKEKAIDQQVGVLASSLQIRADDIRPQIHAEARTLNETKKSSGLVVNGRVLMHPERYDPTTARGRYLLAHEAAHIGQQQAGLQGAAINQCEAEVEAHRIGSAFAAGLPVGRPRVGLATLAIAGDNGDQEGDPSNSPPPSWKIDKGNYYKLKVSAEKRAAELRKEHSTVEVFQRPGDQFWQCRYHDGAPSKATSKAHEVSDGEGQKNVDNDTGSQVPTALQLFKGKVGEFLAAELNDATYTVFGEISAKMHDAIATEAHAVASTIFNRLQAIKDGRAKYADAVDRAADARSKYRETTEALEKLTKNPSHYKKELGDKYDSEVTKARQEHEQAMKANGVAEKERIKALNLKIEGQSYVLEKYRNVERVTLTMIVNDVNQYEGYPAGKKYYQRYPSMNPPEKKRNAKRWEIARQAVKGLAEGSKEPEAYTQFRSNRGGARKLRKGEKRIGGNDFWIK